jgi:hypothetical protein
VLTDLSHLADELQIDLETLAYPLEV